MKWTLNHVFSLNAAFKVDEKIGAEMNCLPRSWVQWRSVCSLCAGPWFGPITSTIITIKWKIKKIKWLAGHLGRILALLSWKHPAESTAAWLCSEELPLITIGAGGRGTLAPVTLQTSLTLKTQPWWTKIWYMNILEMSDNQLLEYHLSMLVVSGN